MSCWQNAANALKPCVSGNRRPPGPKVVRLTSWLVAFEYSSVSATSPYTGSKQTMECM